MELVSQHSNARFFVVAIQVARIIVWCNSAYSDVGGGGGGGGGDNDGDEDDKGFIYANRYGVGE